MDSRSQDWNRLREYADALEEERRKILVFEKELPLSLQLVTHAIESCKQQIGMDLQYYSDCEAASSEERIVEEFIPMKITSSSMDQEDGHQSMANEGEDEIRGTDGRRDWLSSVQLWNTQDSLPSQHDELEEPLEISRKTEEKQAMAASSSHKKARRYWSTDLHKSFLQALQQLGGAHVATPKQIREVMRVKGLTNDEVKSHLQKYRLHTRGPSPPKQSKGTPPSAQFVVLGGLWIPPPEYAGANAGGTISIDSPARQLEVTNNACTNKAYTRVARLQHKQQNSPLPRTTRSTTTGGICSFRRHISSSSLATSSTPHITPSSLFIH